MDAGVSRPWGQGAGAGCRRLPTLGAGWRSWKEEFAAAQASVLLNVAEARALKLKLHAEVFELYGITEEERMLIRETRPPRDPRFLVEQGFVP